MCLGGNNTPYLLDPAPASKTSIRRYTIKRELCGSICVLSIIV